MWKGTEIKNTIRFYWLHITYIKNDNQPTKPATVRTVRGAIKQKQNKYKIVSHSLPSVDYLIWSISSSFTCGGFLAIFINDYLEVILYQILQQSIHENENKLNDEIIALILFVIMQ